MSTEISVSEAGEDGYAVKLSSPTLEINVLIPLGDVGKLGKVYNADWNSRGSLQIGSCAGATTFWCKANADSFSIMIGHDDETWDIAVEFPLHVLDTLRTELEGLFSQRST